MGKRKVRNLKFIEICKSLIYRKHRRKELIPFAELMINTSVKRIFGNMLETFNLGSIYGERSKGWPYIHPRFDWHFFHKCGPRGGEYRIRTDGKCYRCKKQLPTHKVLAFSAKMSKFGK